MCRPIHICTSHLKRSSASWAQSDDAFLGTIRRATADTGADWCAWCAPVQVAVARANCNTADRPLAHVLRSVWKSVWILRRMGISTTPNPDATKHQLRACFARHWNDPRPVDPSRPSSKRGQSTEVQTVEPSQFHLKRAMVGSWGLILLSFVFCHERHIYLWHFVAKWKARNVLCDIYVSIAKLSTYPVMLTCSYSFLAKVDGPPFGTCYNHLIWNFILSSCLIAGLKELLL